MYDQKKYQIETLIVELVSGSFSNEESITMPDGKVIAMGIVVKGVAPDEILSVSLFEGGSEVTRPVFYEFLQKTTGGNFLDSFCPVSIDGGRKYEGRINTNGEFNSGKATAQFMFIIDRNA